MSEKNKKSAPDTPEEQKAEINESIFDSRKAFIKQREEETARQEAEIARQYAQQEKEKREEYERKLLEEKKELMRLKQGLINEEESTVHEEKEEEIKLTFGNKISNFFYHNKWWLGIAAFFTLLGVYLIYDLITTPRPDVEILMLCDNNDVGTSVCIEDYFTDFAEDFNGNGKVLASVNYIPYSDDEYSNYTNGVTGKLSAFLSSAEAIIIIGNQKTAEEVLVPEDTLADLSSLYPDDPHVKDWFYYLKDTKFAEKIGVPESSITDDMFLAIRKPIALANDSKEEMQKTYDKDFPVFDRIIKSLSAGE